MKKILLFALAGAVAVSANAQTPLKRNLGMVGKTTATWCGPCGSWGTQLKHDLETANTGKLFALQIYSSSNGSNDNDKFYCSDAVSLANKITTGGYPTFSYNIVNYSTPNTSGGSVNTAGIKSDINAASASFTSASVVASTGMTYKIDGNTITVETKTKFFEDATGKYNVAVYIVEDGALNKQNGSGTSGNIAHENVLRASMSNTVWGEQVASDPKKDEEFDKTFTLDITTYNDPKSGGATWDKSLLKPIVIIYKMTTPSTPEYVNGNDWYEFPASVSNISKVENVSVYPNPAQNQTAVSFDAEKSTTATINVVDMTGRSVYNSGTLQVNTGRFIHNINTSSIAAGLYNVTISTENGVATQKLNVIK